MSEDIALVNSLFEKYWSEYLSVYNTLPEGVYDVFEGLILYGLIRNTQPRNMVEIGCGRGRSSCISLSALNRNEGYDNFYMSDVDTSAAISNIIERNIEPNKIEVVEGDIRLNIDKIPVEEMDIVFIDAAHEASFAQWYFGALIPRVKKGVLVHVHDINLSGNWQWCPTPDSEAEVFITLHKQNTLPLQKIIWVEDWCINVDYKEARNKLAEQYPVGFNPILHARDTGGVSSLGSGSATWWTRL